MILPRAHRALANLKTWLQGTHRASSAKHLQVYLDEFVFRHNRRRTPMAAFQTLLGLGAPSRADDLSRDHRSSRCLSEPDIHERRFPRDTERAMSQERGP